jgi:hypothetical protein
MPAIRERIIIEGIKLKSADRLNNTDMIAAKLSFFNPRPTARWETPLTITIAIPIPIAIKAD